jgi:tRNA A-37 threonylcarbamoyl transferase component Bud32
MMRLDAPRLRTAGRIVPVPFEVALADGPFAGADVLRLLPGRRLVARGRYGGEDVVLKWFVGRAARRHFERERQGLAAIQMAGVTVPEALATGSVPGGGHALVHRFVAGARPLRGADLWARAGLARLFARLHAAGVVHRDPHPGNFLTVEGGAENDQFLCVDGDAASRVAPAELDEAASIANFADLLAQFVPAADLQLPELLVAYERARDWPPDPGRLGRLSDRLRAARRRRTARYLDKTLRDCSEFSAVRTRGALHVARRSALGAELEHLMNNPDQALGDAALLKDGNSATVYRTALGSRPIVVKRYNVKSPLHRVRRWFKSRARTAWRNGHRLEFLGIPTAAPLALVEERFGPLRGRSWLVMEDCGDDDLAGAVARDGWREVWLDQLVALLGILRALGLGHGDMKATNVLIRNDVLHLIDLDALGERSGGYRVDRDRLLSNWAEQPSLLAPLAARLAAAGLAGDGVPRA